MFPETELSEGSEPNLPQTGLHRHNRIASGLSVISQEPHDFGEILFEVTRLVRSELSDHEASVT